jgi:glycosyltransferase involved in cell wall biosynthesis
MALENIAVVYFGNDWFAENRTSSHHIARLLSKRYPVLYVETPGLRAPKANKRDLKKLWQKLKRALRPAQLVHDNLWVLTVPQNPFRRLPFARALNVQCGRFMVRRAMLKLRFDGVILWFAVPHPGPLAGKLHERFVVYYCIDDYANLPGVDGREVAQLDEKLTRVADQVFVASTTLLDRKKKLNPTSLYSPHGVDFAHFNSVFKAATPIAQGLQHLRHPIIGFFGSIGSSVDIGLLVSVAKARPDWTLLLVGLTSVDVRELEKCSNVVLAGAQPYDRLPEWARAFDVAIIPYRSSNLNVIHANPLKLREYLATGRPVVATFIPETQKFAHCIRLARDSGDFITQIEESLAQDSECDRRQRIKEVEGSSWESRVEQIIGVLEPSILRGAPKEPRGALGVRATLSQP